MTKLIDEKLKEFELYFVEHPSLKQELQSALTASFEAGKAEGKGEALALFETYDDSEDLSAREIRTMLSHSGQTTSSECPICGSDGFCGCWKDV